MTERATYMFRVKEYANGKPWIAAEPLRGDFAALQGKVLGFDLPDGTTYRQAEAIAARMNDELIHISLTP